MTDLVALPVFAWKMPITIDARLTKVSNALTTLYGDTYMRQIGTHMIFYTEGKTCGCQRCMEYIEVMVTATDLLANLPHDWLEFTGGMIVCEECGNKRCPHATDHREECSGSNEPGQIGSSYA